MAKGVAVAGAAIAAAFTAAMTKAVKDANEFQKALANVSTLVDDTEVSTAALAKTVLTELDPALGDATELTEGLYQAFSAGAEDADEALQITTDAAKFATAALTDTFTAVDVLTTATNAYGKEVVTTEQASDIFFQTIRLGKITGDELAATIGQSIPLFASLNVPLEELASGLVTMTKQGVNAANATTQLNSLMNAFLKPSEDMANALESVGFQSGAAFIEQEGLAGALEFLTEQTGLEATELAKLVPNIRGLRGVMALTGTGAETFADALEQMADATGSTDLAFQKQEKTFKTLQNSLKNLSIVVGNIGKSFIDEIAGGATEATQSVIQLITSTPGMNAVANIAGFIAGAFKLIKEVAVPLFDAAKAAVTEVWQRLREEFQELFPNLKDNGGAFRVLASAVQGGIIVLQVMGKSVSALIGLFSGALQSVRRIIDGFQAFADWQRNMFKPEERKKAMDAVIQAAEDVSGIQTDMAKNFVSEVGDIFTTIKDEVSGFTEDVDDMTQKFESSFTVTFDNVHDNVTNNWEEIITGGQGATQAIVDAITQAGEQTNAALAESAADSENTIAGISDIAIGHVRASSVASLEHIGLFSSATIVELTEAEQELIAANKITLETIETDWRDTYDSITNVVNTAFSSITDIARMSNENMLTDLELTRQQDLASLEANIEAKNLTEEEATAERAQIEADFRAEKNALEEKAFNAEKATRIAGVWIDTAAGIVSAWREAAKIPPPGSFIYGGIMSGLLGGTAVAQTAIIAGQQYVPSFQGGGQIRGGMARINERGGEIVNLPDGSVVVPNDISQQIAANTGGNTVINVSFDGAKISDEMDLDMVVDTVARKLGEEMRIRR
jgi:TP901 family phage tail tape measure protein